MLTTTATIVFLLVASSLAALAVHEWLGGGRRRAGQSTADPFATIDDLEHEVRGELDGIQRKLLEGRAALAEESQRLQSVVAQAAAGKTVDPAVASLEASVAAMQAQSEQLGQEIERRGLSCIQSGAQHESAIAACFEEASTGQAELRSNLELLSRAVADLSAQVVDVERAAVSPDRVAALEATVSALQVGGDDTRLVELENVVIELLARVDAQPSLTAFESRMERVEVQCAELSAAQVSEDRLAQIEQSLFSQDLRLCTLEEDVLEMVTSPVAEVTAAPVPAAPVSVEPLSGSERDDLKKIKGIGTVLEQTLNSLGIERFEQVANLTVDEIEVLSEHLGAFASRVERDQWIVQARALAS